MGRTYSVSIADIPSAKSVILGEIVISDLLEEADCAASAARSEPMKEEVQQE
jgi:hypothetical protein